MSSLSELSNLLLTTGSRLPTSLTGSWGVETSVQAVDHAIQAAKHIVRAAKQMPKKFN